MKKFALGLLAVVAISYYLGIDLTEFLPTVPQSDAARDRARHAPVSPEQTPGAAPQPSSTATVSSGTDGSLANRWKTSASPAKP
jgi:hypothetical protein